MIFWNEYKQYKATAQRLIGLGDSPNIDIRIELRKGRLSMQSEEQTIENLINILSGGEHFKDNPFYEIKKGNDFKI